VCNIPMAPGSTLQDYQAQFDQQIIPFLKQFQPDLLLVSAGYDATAADPLAGVNLMPMDYGIFTTACKKITPRILFGLEGGYEYKALSQSVIATIEAALTHSEKRD
ncbi:MAG: histone deacetylase, partial [Leptolyngbya sp. SIO3F4]|nr:histone deacetylase [Leptolyngbya sp. SIO3F4]